MGGPQNAPVKAQPTKLYYSYDQIHSSIANAVEAKGLADKFNPTMILAIGGEQSAGRPGSARRWPRACAAALILAHA